MKQRQLSFFSLVLLTSGSYAMHQDNAPSALFVQKVQQFGLVDRAEVQKFFEVAQGHGIDLNSEKVKYSHSENAGTTISIFQTIGRGYREITRLPNGVFDIATVEEASLGIEKGAYRAQKQTYENVLATLNMHKSAQEYKAKLAAQPEEKPLTLLEMQQRAMRLMSMSPEQRMAEALKNMPTVDSFAPVRTSVQKPAAASQPTPPSAPTPPSTGRIADSKGFIHQAFGPDAVQNNQKARELLQRDDVKKFIDAEIKKGAITKSWQELNAIAVFEADAPFKGAWKIHLGKGMSIMWLGGLSIESTDIQF